MEISPWILVGGGLALLIIGIIVGQCTPKFIVCDHKWEKKTVDVKMNGGYGDGVIVLWKCPECSKGRAQVHFADQIEDISTDLAESMITKEGSRV